MNNDNIFYLLVEVVFSMSPQLGGIGPKAQEPFTSFKLTEGESLPDFHLQDIQSRGEIHLLNDETGQKKYHG